MASILVVDPDPQTRERIAFELRALGYDVTASAAVLSPPPTSTSESVEMVSAGGIAIDPMGHWVIINGDYITLSPREFSLLLFLLSHRDRVYSREQLLSRVWRKNDCVGLRTVDVHVRRLRSVLERYRKDSYIQTVRGAGYRFSLN